MNKPPRIAIIDIGTNSTLYLIAESGKDELRILDQGTRTTRLGRNLHKDGSVGEKDLTFTIEVLKEYQKIFNIHGIDEVIAVGTEVFRRAKNRDSVIDEIRRQTGFQIRILSPDQEAKIIFRGALDGRLHEDILVIDIGGGSTELIQGNSDGLENLVSYPFGAVVMTDRFLASDPPSPEEWTSLCEFVRNNFDEIWKNRISATKNLIGVGGTVTTLSVLHQALDHYNRERVHNSQLTAQQVDELVRRLSACDLAGRKNLLPVDPERADIIIAGALILRTIMETGGFKSITVSDHGLRYGVALYRNHLF